METIVALATPPGEGALHVIRMSGRDAFPIINALAVDPVERTVDRLQVTFLRSRSGELMDQVVIGKFYAPHSYTGEDCIEISCHGNGLISRLIMEELIRAGAVYARRGEFTKRAYLNGKMDLNQAMGVGALFGARTESDVYASVREIRGTNSAVIRGHMDALFRIIGECELNLDYPREIEVGDEETLAEIRGRIGALSAELTELAERSGRMRLSGYRVVFVGRPNAGKSSLVNHLVGGDRIMVSDRAGTTQDPIEVDYRLDGYLLTLVDTAGVDSAEDLGRHEAAVRSRRELEGADLVVHLTACGGEEGEYWTKEVGGRPCIRVFTKADLAEVRPENSISVKEGDVEFLLAALRGHLAEDYSPVGLRSKEAVNHLGNARRELEAALGEGLTLDLMLEHLHTAHDQLGLILGIRRDAAEKINMLFDGFCVGK